MMVRAVIHILVVAVALIVAAYLVPGMNVDNILVVLVAALVLGLLNFFVKPVIVLLTLPITIITLGLFTFFINACLVLLTARFVNGFSVDGFFSALLGSFVISIVATLLHRFIK